MPTTVVQGGRVRKKKVDKSMTRDQGGPFGIQFGEFSLLSAASNQTI
jgi:hypothetical protein